MGPILNNIYKRLRRIKSKRLVVAAGFAVAMGAMSFGPAFQQSATAQFSGVRDCSSNSINNQPLNGGCGALSPQEFIADVRDNNPSDLQTIYADPRLGGLTSDKYDRFAKTAKMGTAHKNGNIVVDGRVVMTDARTVGRETFPGQRDTIVIGGRTYFHSRNMDSFQSQTIPVMVMFDNDGMVEFAVLTACGNPVMAKKVPPPKKKVEKKEIKEVVEKKEVIIKEVEKKEEKKEEKKPPPELPKAGPASLVGVFVGSSAVGTIAHSLFMSYRRRKK